MVSGVSKRQKVPVTLRSGSAPDGPVPPGVSRQHPVSLSSTHTTFAFPGLLDALVSMRRCISAGFVGDVFSLRKGASALPGLVGGLGL